MYIHIALTRLGTDSGAADLLITITWAAQANGVVTETFFKTLKRFSASVGIKFWRAVLDENVERLRENVENIRECVGVGGMAEPLKSAAPLSVPRRVKTICFNILQKIPVVTCFRGGPARPKDQRS